MVWQFPGLWLAGFVAGVLTAEAGLPVGVAWLAGTHLAALWSTASGERGTAGVVLLLAVTTGAVALGGPLAVAERERPPVPFEATVEGEIVSVRHQKAVSLLVLERVRGPGAPRVPRSLELWVDRGPDGEPGLAARPPGCRIRARVRIAPRASRRNPGARDSARSALRRGHAAQARLVHPRFHAPVSRACQPSRWQRFREASRSRLGRAGPGGGLLAALALGETGALPAELRSALADLGLAHLLAVSGLHLALVAGLAFAVGRWASLRLPWALRDGRRAGLLVGLSSAAGYAAFAGLGVPVQRAMWLLGALAVGALRRHPLPPAQGLGLAAAAVLLLEPAALFAASAQLSFAATAALVLGPRRSAQARSAVVELLHVSATALLATAPLAAFHFGQATPVGLLANLLAVPLTGLFLLPLALATALLAPWPVADSLVTLATDGVGFLLEGTAVAAAWVPARTPHQPSVFTLVSCGVLALLVLRTPSTAARVLGVGVICAGLAWGPAAVWRPEPPRLVVLDVGQGDAILVQTADRAVLVDAGAALPGRYDRGRSVVVPALAALGVRRLDLVVATHADIDHRGGLPAVLAAFPCDRLWLPYGGIADPAFAALREVAELRGVRVEERGAGGAPARWTGLEVAPLWPPRTPRPSTRNAGSLVLRISVGGRRVLLPGDLPVAQEEALLARGSQVAADVLLLGHHGSRTSSGARFLDAVAPSLAIASGPRFSPFGTPHREVRERLRARGIRLAWTGRDGAVAVQLGPGSPRPQAVRRDLWASVLD